MVILCVLMVSGSKRSFEMFASLLASPGHAGAIFWFVLEAGLCEEVSGQPQSLNQPSFKKLWYDGDNTLSR